MYRSISPSEVDICVAELSSSLEKVDRGTGLWLRDEARRISVRLLAIHTLLNQTVPIHSLPNEILLHIFTDVVAESPIPYLWYHMTHVCRLWRDLALQSSELWTGVSLHNLDYASACIKRSGNRPIQLGWHPQRHTLPGSPERFLNLLAESQVDGIDLKVSHDQMNSLVKQDESGSEEFVFNLERLRILELRQAEDDWVRYSKPVVLSALRGPCRLHTLKLCAVVVPWKPFIFTRHLHVLHLECIQGALTPNCGEFIRLLQNCPSLEELNLIDAGPGYDPRLTSLNSVAELRSLRSIVLVNNRGDPVRGLVEHIVIPNVARLHFDVTLNSGDTRPDGSGFDLKVYVPRDVSHIGVLRTLVSASVSCTGYTISIRGFTADNLSRISPDFHLTIQGWFVLNADERLRRYSQDFWRVLSSSRVRALSLYLNITLWQIEDWHTLRAFQSLEWLKIEHRSGDTKPVGEPECMDAATRIVQALSPSSITPRSQGQSIPLLRRLDLFCIGIDSSVQFVETVREYTRDAGPPFSAFSISFNGLTLT